jgi:hypothetical protein
MFTIFIFCLIFSNYIFPRHFAVFFKQRRIVLNVSGFRSSIQGNVLKDLAINICYFCLHKLDDNIFRKLN